MNRFLTGLCPTLHIAHRGGAALAPENSLAAFERAITRWRTQMLELDVHQTLDGELVVAHDPTVNRCTDGHGELQAMTVRELQALDAGYRFTADGRTFPFRGQGVRIPLLRELLRAFPSMKMNIELKAGSPAAFAALLRSEGAVDRVCCGGESDAMGEALVRELPEACHFYPRDALTAFVVGVKSGAGAPVDERYTVLDMPLWFGDMRLFDAELLEAAKGAGKWINVWTIDDRSEMERLVREGVGGIMTDRPDLLRQVLD